MRHVVGPVALLALTLPALLACSPRHPATVRWTVDGQDPAEACEVLGDTVNVVVVSQDRVDAPPVMDEPVTAECSAGSADVGVGNFATVYAELYRAGLDVGRSSPKMVSADGGLVGSLNPLSGSILLDADIEVDVGFLEVGFEAQRMPCDELGIGDVEVQLMRLVTGLDREPVWEEPQTHACDEGFVLMDAQVGETYYIEATAEAGGKTYGTVPPGHRVEQANPVMSTVVNLVEVMPPAE